MRTLVALLAAAALAAGTFAASASAHAHAASKTCSAGYVRASLSWGVKCLRAGEFCKVRNVEYRRYGYTCPAGGHLVRSRASR